MAVLAGGLTIVGGCADDGPPRAAAASMSTSSTASSTSTSASSTTTTAYSHWFEDLPATLDTPVGTWTSSFGPSTIDAREADPGLPVGPGDDVYGHAQVYDLGGHYVAVGDPTMQRTIGEDVPLIVWRRTSAGEWERSATGPPMPAYRMRHSALMSVKLLERDDDLLVFDAEGDLLRITADGDIQRAAPPRFRGTRDGWPTDSLPALATDGDEAFLAVTDMLGMAMWRQGWPEWRTISLPPIDAGGPATPLVWKQARCTDGRFFIDVDTGNGRMLTWELTDPA